jgi:hypothetical protein
MAQKFELPEPDFFILLDKLADTPLPGRGIGKTSA